MRFHSFRSFRGRLVAVFVGLFAVILATCFLVVAAAVRASARHEIGEELRLAGTLFVRQPESRSQQLVAATRPLSGDFALKTAAATADQETTRSVLANHRQRIAADVLMLCPRRAASLPIRANPAVSAQRSRCRVFWRKPTRRARRLGSS